MVIEALSAKFRSHRMFFYKGDVTWEESVACGSLLVESGKSEDILRSCIAAFATQVP